MYRPEYDPDIFFHWKTLSVRFRDLDPLNHVNNSVFNTYFEEARIDFIHHVPEMKASMNEGKSFILAHLEMDYVSPVYSGERVIVGSSMKELGNSSVKGIQALYTESTKKLNAVCETTGVWFDLQRNRPARLPEISNPGQYLFKMNKNG
ncbi:acyl-CoA thioesterase [Rhodohalobacter mucosus]|uniref:Acyl-CoA thioesterase n=1 Tax=Rhodohalobacter mucosus TaxID=2079485 RepID=A0A316TW73_9BACT|nr:thioesterase family protein [Rhodohalobacter mucosus]PWN07445.1 acyl-CoA thioesterase [Rhodohalobacter mucosus]